MGVSQSVNRPSAGWVKKAREKNDRETRDKIIYISSREEGQNNEEALTLFYCVCSLRGVFIFNRSSLNLECNFCLLE